MAFQEADMQEQTYPPKRPNMAHFDSPQERRSGDEVKPQQTPDGRERRSEPRQRADKEPAP
jgi:hypothetical protein